MEKTIKLNLEKAKKLYKTADNTFKEFLESNFSKKDLSPVLIEDITYEKACEILREKEYDKSYFLFEH